MKNPFIYSNDNKRYHTLNYYNRSKFGEKIYKAVLDCGFTCPNIDGTKGFGGCIFCDSGSGYFTDGTLDIDSQLDKEISRICRKYGEKSRITAYFQANTNTFAPAEKLSELYNRVLKNNHIHGISVGTRADCLPDDIMEVLCKLNQRTNLTVELGLQSIHNETALRINRCCSYEEFLTGYSKLKSTGIRTCIHIINGLLWETDRMMLETAREISKLRPDAVKIQMLHVIQGTKLAQMYSDSPFRLISKEEYIDITIRQLELLPPETVIERITGDGDKSKLIAPMWSTDKISVLGGIDKHQAELNSWQGKFFKEKID